MNIIDLEKCMKEHRKNAINPANGDFGYMHGMYNGLELARSVLTGEEPIFMNMDGTLDQAAVERNPERFI